MSALALTKSGYAKKLETKGVEYDGASFLRRSSPACKTWLNTGSFPRTKCLISPFWMKLEMATGEFRGETKAGT